MDIGAFGKSKGKQSKGKPRWSRGARAEVAKFALELLPLRPHPPLGNCVIRTGALVATNWLSTPCASFEVVHIFLFKHRQPVRTGEKPGAGRRTGKRGSTPKSRFRVEGSRFGHSCLGTPASVATSLAKRNPVFGKQEEIT